MVQAITLCCPEYSWWQVICETALQASRSMASLGEIPLSSTGPALLGVPGGPFPVPGESPCFSFFHSYVLNISKLQYLQIGK